MYFDRNATQSAAKRRGSGGMDRRSNAAWVSPQAVRAVVKRTEEDEIYLVTFHKSHTRNLRSEQKRGVLVRDAR